MSDRRPHLLVVDDDPALLDWLRETLERRYLVETTSDPRTVVTRAATGDVDVIITDLEMPELRGDQLLAAVRKTRPEQVVLMTSAFAGPDLTAEMVRQGAADLLAKPFSEEVLFRALEKVLARQRPDQRSTMVAVGPAMQRVRDVARKAARSQTAVLLTGETGVGKTMLARYIHDTSGRSHGPFVEVNCRIVDAAETHASAFLAASGGTVVFDEISELHPDAQAKLRAVLETNRVRPQPGAPEQTIDARVISTTSRPLQPLVDSGAFRRDLLYHINIIPIAPPPLRERPEDIPALVQILIARTGRSIDVTDDAIAWIREQPWPGNVRQLASALQRGLALSKGDAITAAELEGAGPEQVDDAFERGLFVAAERHVSLDQLERAYILRVIDAVAGNMAEAARILRIDRRTLYRKVARE